MGEQNSLEVKLPGGLAAHVAGSNLIVIVVMVALLAAMGYVLHFNLSTVSERLSEIVLEQRTTNQILLEGRR